MRKRLSSIGRRPIFAAIATAALTTAVLSVPSAAYADVSYPPAAPTNTINSLVSGTEGSSTYVFLQVAGGFGFLVTYTCDTASGTNHSSGSVSLSGGWSGSASGTETTAHKCHQMPTISRIGESCTFTVLASTKTLNSAGHVVNSNQNSKEMAVPFVKGAGGCEL